MKAFQGETEEWTRCYLAALVGRAATERAASTIAAEAAEIADAAMGHRRERQAKRNEERRAARAKALHEVQRIGCFASPGDTPELHLVLRKFDVARDVYVAWSADPLARKHCYSPHDLLDGEVALTPAPDKLDLACRIAVAAIEWRRGSMGSAAYVQLTWPAGASAIPRSMTRSSTSSSRISGEDEGLRARDAGAVGEARGRWAADRLVRGGFGIMVKE